MKTENLNHTTDLTDIHRTFHPIKENVRSSQVHVEHAPQQTTYQATKQVLTNSTSKLYKYLFQSPIE